LVFWRGSGVGARPIRARLNCGMTLIDGFLPDWRATVQVNCAPLTDEQMPGGKA